MGLERFAKGDFETNADASVKKTALIFDTHNLVFRTLFVAHSEDPLDVTFTYWKTLMLQSINAAIKKHKPHRVILALDSGSWRKDYYAEYKGQRAEGREKSAVDFEKFFPIMSDFFEQIKTVFPNIYVIKAKKCEADDIIAILVSKILTNWKCICVSSDRDMYQLHKYSHYSQYDPIKKLMIKCINPEQYLLLKIITGDGGDNIPAIAPRVGIKTAEKILKKLDQELAEDAQKAANFERNKVLIDFTCIPNHIIELIRNEFNDYELKEFKGRALMDFLTRNGSNGLITYLPEYVANFKPLI